MRSKVVVDTNIFVGAWFEGDQQCQRIIEEVYDRDILLLFSQETIGELVYVVKNFVRHTFDDTHYRIVFLSHLMDLFYHALSINTMNKNQVEHTCEDQYDQMFLDCAVIGGADYVITNDFNSGLFEMNGLCGELEFMSATQFVFEYIGD